MNSEKALTLENVTAEIIKAFDKQGITSPWYQLMNTIIGGCRLDDPSIRGNVKEDCFSTNCMYNTTE